MIFFCFHILPYYDQEILIEEPQVSLPLDHTLSKHFFPLSITLSQAPQIITVGDKMAG